MPDWAEARRDPIPLPVTGCAAAKVYPGGRPPRFNKHMYSSSSMVGGWWNDALFAELNRSTSPYPYPTATPTPSPRPRLAPHLRHALLLARVSLPSVHAVPSPVRARPPSLLPRPSCHAALTAHLPPNPPPLRRRTRGTPLPELPAVGQGKSTSSQIGSFWHDKHMYGPDLNNQQLRQRSAYPEPHREPEPQR